MAQQPAPTFETVPMPDGSEKQAYAVGVTEPRPVRKQFAFTFNPLNLLIGRYGFNFEYQPVLHHGLIVTPHFDYLSGKVGTDACENCSDTLKGGGVELGYRFYSGKLGLDGFFLGPSLIVTWHRLIRLDPPDNYDNIDVNFTGVGGAFDVGWQQQLGHFIIGGSIGVQYTRTNKRLPLFGDGEDLSINLNDGSFQNGTSVLPRLAFNLGYAL